MKLVVVRDRSLYQPDPPAGAKAPEPPKPGEFDNIKHFDAGFSIEAPESKKFTTVKDGDVIVDYRDVQIKGYLSTFKATTESDRQGDYVDPGAFTDTIKNFMAKNPVLLRDHINMTSYLAGSFTKMKEDSKGLYVEAALSNSPDVRDTRFKVAEGHLKTLSMGGLFHYKEDGRGIFKVDLWEGSLTPIPANPDATFSVRSLTDDEKHFIKSGGAYPSYRDFLRAIYAQNRAGLAA